jgi:hypothetical protein
LEAVMPRRCCPDSFCRTKAVIRRPSKRFPSS